MSDDGWTWELAADADADLDGPPPDEQDRILEKLDEIVSSPWRDAIRRTTVNRSKTVRTERYASVSFGCP